MDARIKYAVWQLEAGQTGTIHFQGFIMFNERIRLTQLRQLIPGAHFEIARGTPEQARDYCMKEEGRLGYPNEIGVFDPDDHSGKRTDLSDLRESFINGISEANYAKNYFDKWLRYPKALQNWNAIYAVPRDSSVAHQCIVFFGLPGTGKSYASERLARELGGTGGFYFKPVGKWWDGYAGQRVVWMDDFRGNSMSLTDFKRSADRYPCRVEIKGGSAMLLSTVTIITTNIEPINWWNGPDITAMERSAVTRRITCLKYFFAERTYYEFSSYPAFELFYNNPQRVDGTGLMEAVVLPEEHHT